MKPVPNRSVFTLFFISGFTALVFEVVWAKQACLVFGNTTLASAAVISAFMTGLAIGSHFFGKIADTKPGSSLKLYGWLEGGIGLFAILFPLLMKVLRPLYGLVYASCYQDFLTLSLLRFALSFLILLIPTALMGGTFPLLARFLSKGEKNLKENIGCLYAMNLFGAMTGSFASGFILLGNAGILLTSLTAAVLNLGIFCYVSIRTSEAKNSADTSVAAGDPAPTFSAGQPGADTALDRKIFILITGLMGLHGFCAFVIQICWTRTMALILGSSTYSFSAVLTTFLAGLGLGSFAVAYLAKKNTKLGFSVIGFMEISVGFAVLFFIPAFEWLVYYFVKFFPLIRLSVFSVFAAQFIFSAAAMIVPTFLMGLVFPAVLNHLGKSKDIGRVIGWTYASNTIGGVLGSFMTAFFLIPKFGIIGSLRIAGLISFAAGAIFLLASDKARWKLNMGKTILIFLAFIPFLFYPWNREVFSSGVFIYARSYTNQVRHGKEGFVKGLNAGNKNIFYKDGISSTVTVIRTEMREAKGTTISKSLRVNGKTDASTFGDMATQLYMGYIPLLAHHDPREVLVVGLGAGVTLGTVTHFHGVEHIECVEIEPAVVDANRYFTAENHHALEDPRLHMIIGDGRNHITFSQKKYDIIISEPSNPWISGVSSLFTRENYEAALKRLNSDGIYCQWFHSYQMSKDDFVMILRTFASVFPRVNLYKIRDSDYLLLGSRNEISFNDSRMTRMMRENKYAASDLRFFSEGGGNFLLRPFVLSDADLRRALASEKMSLNTDDHLALEYNAPKFLYQDTPGTISAWLNSIRREDFFPRFEDRTREEILSSPDLWKIMRDRGAEALASKNYDYAVYCFKEAIKLGPGLDPRIHYPLGLAYEAKKQFREAIRHYLVLRGLKEREVQIKSAVRRARLKMKLEENPLLQRDVKVYNLIAALSFLMGDSEEALRSINTAINVDPQYTKNYSDMAVYLSSAGFPNEGMALLRKVEQINPSDAGIQAAKKTLLANAEQRALQEKMQLGVNYILLKDFEAAKLFFEKTVEEDPDNFIGWSYLSDSEAGLGMKERAAAHKQQALELYEKKTNPGVSSVK